MWVPKAGEGLRPLAVWALRDRVVQRAIHDYLEPYFEPRFLDCSHGFRPARSVDTAVRAVLAARDAGLCWVLDADIQDCFPSIDAQRLVATVRASVPDPIVPGLLERWVTMPMLDRDGRPRPAGISQGGVLSPLLCNVYLHAFDVAMTEHGIRLVRYADDLVCLGQRKRDVEAALHVAEETLARLGMRLHPGKTQLTHFDRGFPFLGVFFLRAEHFRLSPPSGRRQGAPS